MSGKKKLLVVLLLVLLFGAVAAGLGYHSRHYVMVEFTFYPKDAQKLDLREEDISIRHFRKLSRRLPECEILWNVPFQDTAYSSDTRKITITGLTEKDIGVLDYLTELETVQAMECTDYFQLLALREHRPELTVRYQVQLGEGKYACTAQEALLKGVAVEEVAYLSCLPELKQVTCGISDPEAILAVRDYCREKGLEFCLDLGGKTVAEDTAEVEAGAVTEEDLTLLQFLPELKSLHMIDPKALAKSLLQLREELPGVDISWEREVCGKRFSTEEEVIDLSDVEVTDLDQVKKDMAYFSCVGKVFLGECGLDNEELAAYREQVREDYKVVWTVQLGEKLKARTDDTTFMPVREYVYYFNDEEAYNLRYCEDMVCIDIGHMSIHNIDWVEFMPNLQYLILAHTQLQYIEPIKHCKNLKFLELDWSPIKDLSPLVECTGLEDLNLGNTFADFEPIGQMTWLKNLWMIGCSRGAAFRMTQALTETTVMISGQATVSNGWRNLQNYYDMRDLLGMEYMSG